jgi:hypothetical protein
MRDLEASLDGSRKALLALDVAGIERGTSEQVSLLREFDAIRGPTREDGAAGVAAHTPELERELRRSGMRIVEVAGLQTALLARARSKLRVLANMLAGPSVDYGQLLVRRGEEPRSWDGKHWK